MLESVEFATLKAFEEPLLTHLDAHEREGRELIYEIGRARELRGGLALDEGRGSVGCGLETVEGDCT